MKSIYLSLLWIIDRTFLVQIISQKVVESSSGLTGFILRFCFLKSHFLKPTPLSHTDVCSPLKCPVEVTSLKSCNLTHFVSLNRSPKSFCSITLSEYPASFLLLHSQRFWCWMFNSKVKSSDQIHTLKTESFTFNFLKKVLKR